MVVYFGSLMEDKDESARRVPLAKTSLGRPPPPDEEGPKGGHIKGGCGRMALKLEMGVGGSHPPLGTLERVAGEGSVVDME